MKYIFFLTFSIVVFANSDFITPMEYASQLYNNPRGIGCQECHGKHGEGLVIAKYKHKNRDRIFVSPRINNVDFIKFKKVLNRRTKGMPRYFLTNQEIEALYFYLHSNDNKKKINDK